MATNDKYDRQIRLWGSHGQRVLSGSNVLLLGASAAGTETLKNLILPAVGSFTVVDDAVVQQRDCGTNFFVTKDHIGQPKAQVVAELLGELNPDVIGNFFNLNNKQFVATNAALMRNQQLIIVTDPTNELLATLSRFCQENGTALISLRQYGMIGIVRSYKAEVSVIESKPSDVIVDDLRINNPFPALLEYALAINQAELDDMVHAHIPYNLILIRAIHEWKSSHEGNLPKTQDDKDQFTQLVKSKSRDLSKELNFEEALSNIFKATRPYSLRYSLEEIFNDPKISDQAVTDHFWLLAAALHQFYDQHNVLPLAGTLPDMVSTTDFYLTMQNIYIEKAKQDLEVFTKILNTILVARGLQQNSIVPEDIKMFCQNSQIIEITRMRAPHQELENPDYDDFMNEFYDPESLASWYVTTRAVEQFRTANGRYPGQSDSQLEKDFEAVKAEADALMKQVIPDDSVKIEDKYIKEIVRFSDSELHSISAFLGGVASQEAIKILIRQYTPLNHTLLFDGIHGKSQIFNI